MLKFGLINYLENPAGKSERQVAQEQQDLSIRAEEYGFDSVWLVEHHFSKIYGHCVSSPVMLSALANATRTVRLGSGVVPLPLLNPVRVAEEFALIDLMSDGRLEFGIGRGFQPAEFRGYGVEQGASREIFNEALEVILQAWTRDQVNMVGKHFRFENVVVTPKPLQKPHPPIWMAAVSPESFAYAGARGFNLICGPVFGLEEDYLDKNLALYRKSLQENGFDPGSKQIAALFMVYVAADKSKAEPLFSEAAVWSLRALGMLAAPPSGAVPTYERYSMLRDRVAGVEWREIRESDAAIWGTPDQCVEKISALEQRLGFTTMLCWTRIGSLERRAVLDSMGMMQDYIIPEMKRRTRSANS